MKSYRIASIPGDGIGNEVIPAGMDVLAALAGKEGFDLRFEHFDWSSERYKKTGAYIPEGGLEKLKTFDAIFFGAVGAPDVPDHVSLWGLRLPICQGFDQYANVRPARVLPGVTSPAEERQRDRLGDHPRELRGRVLGHRRPRAPGPARGSRDRDFGLHAQGRRAHPPLRVRAGAASGRASTSRSSPSPTRSATAWCCGTRSSTRWRRTIPT